MLLVVLAPKATCRMCTVYTATPVPVPVNSVDDFSKDFFPVILGTFSRTRYPSAAPPRRRGPDGDTQPTRREGQRLSSAQRATALCGARIVMFAAAYHAPTKRYHAPSSMHVAPWSLLVHSKFAHNYTRVVKK